MNIQKPITMKVKLSRDSKPSEIGRVKILIGDSRYTFSESVDGRLVINKISDGNTDEMLIYSRSSNEIEII